MWSCNFGSVRSVTALAAIVLFVASAVSSLAQPSLSEVGPATIDALFAKYDSAKSPGCAVGVIHEGKLLYSRGYGLANLEHDIPNTPQTVFYIGSTSKQFTALAIANLIVKGTLKASDPIRRYLPELPSWADQVTINHLVHHTSGIPDFFALMPLAGLRLEDVHDDGDIIRFIGRQPRLNFAPGETFQYSNSGYFLLAVIVNRLTGKSLRSFADETFFKPLGMLSTHFHDDRTLIVPKRAAGYEPKGAGFAIFASLFDRVGDGGVMTSIDDIVKWDTNYYDGKAGGKDTVQLATTPGRLSDGRQLDYGYGLFLRDYRGLRQVSHGGIYLGYRADLLRFPDQKLSVACFCNLYNVDVSKIAQQVADLYLSKFYSSPDPALAELKTVRVNGEELQGAVGTYLDLNSGMTVVVTVDNGQFKAAFPGSGFATMNLVPIGAHKFKASNSLKSDFEFVTDSKPNVLKLKLLQGPGSNPVFLPRINPVSLQPADLQEFAGTYYSAALDTSYVISAATDHLSMAGLHNPVRTLNPTAPDTFAGGGFFIKFHRLPDRRIISYDLSDPTGRVSRIDFRRES